MISVEKLSITYSGANESADGNRRPPLLQNVDLVVQRGETFVIIGPSGSGKSVLLKVIAGLIPPSTGTVRVEGRAGMLFQKNALFDSLTVAENLAFPLREEGKFSTREIEYKVHEHLDYVGLSQSALLMPDEISGGMQKRVGIARALILNPDVIYYDDPTAGLDPITSRLIIDLIMNLKKKLGTTIIAVTNEMNRAFQMAHRLGIVLDRTLVITGTPEETKSFGDPRVKNFVEGKA